MQTLNGDFLMGRKPSNEILSRPAWADRLSYRRLITLKRRSQTQIALDVGIEQSGISNLESGKTNILELSPARLAAIAKAYGYNNVFDMQSDLGLDFKLGQPPPLMLEPNALELTDFVIRPLEPLSAAAGQPLDVSEHQKSAVYIMPTLNYKNSYRFFIAEGDSMNSGADSIQDGDTLIVDTAERSPRENHVYVIQDQTGAVVVKRVQNWHGQWWLTSDNLKYPPFQLTEATILGRVADVEGKRKNWQKK
jgi:transcriptional regulator with XRE-family HTH domain